MKRESLPIICVLLFIALNSSGREPLANEGKSGLYVQSIQQVLQLKEQEVDLATAVLIASEYWNDNVPGRRYLTKLDSIALEIRTRLQSRNLRANEEAVAVINKYLFGELGFKPTKQENDPDDLFLHSVLDRRQGQCLGLSILYLAIGERLGLPLYGVVVPGHFFIRYDDGWMRFNIETTSKGGFVENEYYISKYNVPQCNNDSIYMINLNKIQTLGCFFNNLGSSYYKVGDRELALAAYKGAVQINPLLAEARANLANVYLDMGQTERAITECETAVNINPGNANARNSLGNAYTAQGSLDKAISQYHQSLELSPSSIYVYENLAIVYCKQREFDHARSVLNQAIVLDPKNAALYNQLGNIDRQMNDYKKAIRKYRKALEIKNDLADANFGLALCYHKLGLIDYEIRAYKRVLAVEPDMIAALINLGAAYAYKQNYVAAVTEFKKALQLKPHDPAIHYNLGVTYSNKTDYEQSAAEYLKAIEIEPEMAEAHRNLGFVFYKLNEYNLAWKHIKIAHRLGVNIDEGLISAVKHKLK